MAMTNEKKWDKAIQATSKALGNKATRQPEKTDPFDIFSTEFMSKYGGVNFMDKDRQTSREKDDYKTGVENYLARKKAHRKSTPTEYNDEQYTIKTPFSSPEEDQQIVAPTNMGEYNDEELGSFEYSDPIISTKPTPTSEKLGLPRPGPSSFIQTARYNPNSKRLNIQYTDGKIFPYYDVSPELADEILTKKAYHSPGQTLLGTIFYGNGTTSADEITDIEEGM